MKIRKARQLMHAEIGREPSEPELAHFLEMPVEKLRQYTKSALNVVSLENPLRNTGNGKSDIDTRTLGDTIVSDAPTPLEDAQEECLRQDLEQVLLDALTPTERAVMMARYGLEDGHPKSLEETSRVVGVSRERVRLVEAKALNKLRSPQTNYRLKTYVGGSPTATAGATKRLSDLKAKKARHSKAATASPAKSSHAKNTANPFAMPFAYSKRNSKQEENSQVSDEQKEQETSHASAGADRLWFL